MYSLTGNELFYAMLYLSYFTSGPLYMFVILAVVCFPVAVLKSAIACLQVFLLDREKCKVYHNFLFQGYLAAVNLVGIDSKEREAIKKE